MKPFCKKISSLVGLSDEEIQSMIEKYNGDSSSSEKNSWRKSLPKLIRVVHEAGLDNLYIVAEYALPAGGRIDATLLGYDKQGRLLALIVELKQWSRGGVAYRDSNGFPAIRVEAKEPYLSRHPVTQTEEYVKSLSRNFSSVTNGKLLLKACQYLHEFEKSESEFFKQGLFCNIDTSQMFFSGDEEKLISYLNSIFSSEKDGCDAKDIFLEGEYKITEFDMEIINKITESPENIPLWHDQIRILDDIKVLLERQLKGELETKHMVLISGAAGTGKTIVGFRILAEYWKMHHEKDSDYKCVYTLPRSRTIKQVLDGLRNDQSGISPVFLNYLSENKRDLLVVDEGHRITELNETGSVFNTAQIVVILQDDNQRVLGNEIGTVMAYKQFANQNDFIFTNFTLNFQKRSGLGSYVNRVDKLLYGTHYEKDVGLGLEVQICDSLKELEELVKRWHDQTLSVKYYAPYCWEWKSRNDLSKIDIQIEDGDYLFQKQWNPMDHQYNWYLDSIEQIGCVYTAQGLGYDYIAFIWWEDLVWRENHWEIDMNKVTKYDNLLKKSLIDVNKDYDYLMLNIYRVLLTRAKKGMCIWFKDLETKKHFERVCLKQEEEMKNVSFGI